jgi:hypothetical protein
LTEADKFTSNAISELQRYCTNLAVYTDRVCQAAETKDTPDFRPGDLLKEISETADTCQTAIAFFAEKTSLPWALAEWIGKAQGGIFAATRAIIMLLQPGR